MPFEKRVLPVERSAIRNIAFRALAATLLVMPASQASSTSDTRLTSLTDTVASAEENDPSCGVTEVQQPIPAIYTRYLVQTYDREITVLDSNFVRQNPRYRYIQDVERLVPRTEDESERAYAERVVSITRRLSDLELMPTVQNVRDSIGAISNARERYRNQPIFNETILFLSGAVTKNPDSAESVYATPQVMARLRGLGNVQHFSGLLSEREDCAWTTVESLESTRKAFLESISETPTPVTILVRGHGAEDFIELGTVGYGESLESVRLTAIQLAGAFAERYVDESVRERAEEHPDTIILDDCYIYPLAAEAFLQELRRIGNERGVRLPTPLIITAVERRQLAFRGQLMERLLFENPNQAPTVGMLYPDRDLLGSRTQNSNATVIARDRRGRPLQIG